MTKSDILNKLLELEKINQEKYNKHMLENQDPEIRQLMTQLRDMKMQNITQLQMEVNKTANATP
jgi:hypothetical protein